MLRHHPFKLVRRPGCRFHLRDARAIYWLVGVIAGSTVLAHWLIFPLCHPWHRRAYDASATVGCALAALLSSMEPDGVGASDPDEENEEYCEPCGAWRPPRAHHCRACNRCVRVFDHHCHGLRACIGQGTHRWFLGYMLAQVGHERL